MKQKIYYAIITIFVIAICILTSFYLGSKSFREKLNDKVFSKKLSLSELKEIPLEGEDVKVYTYDEYVAILKDDKLTIMNKKTKELSKINVILTKPVFMSNGKYLLIADEGKQDIYLIYETSLQWKKTVEGKIYKATLNSKGAVGVCVKGTIYKSVLVVFSPLGEELFKTNLAQSLITNISISDNFKKIAFSDVVVGNTIIRSNIKVIGVDKINEKFEDTIIENYKFEANELIIDIKYDSDNLIVRTDKRIYKCKDNNIEELANLEDKIIFADINLNAYILLIKKSKDNNNEDIYYAETINIKTKKSNIKTISGNPKNILATENVIVLNLGNEILVLNTKAKLKKEIPVDRNIKELSVSRKVMTILESSKIQLLEI